MTVKCLTTTEKQSVCFYYKAGTELKDIAIIFLVSPRTINRVLIEGGLATPVQRSSADYKRFQQLLAKHNLTVEQLDLILSLHHTPHTNNNNETSRYTTVPQYQD